MTSPERRDMAGIISPANEGAKSAAKQAIR